MKAVLINKSNPLKYQIQNRVDQYPKPDMSLFEDMDPNLEWMLVYEPYPEPPYDSRIYTMVPHEEYTNTPPHPDYPLFNQFRVTYIPVKRTNDEIKKAISDVEANSNEGILPIDKRVKVLTLAVATLYRKVGGITLTAKEQAVADGIMELAVKMWKNDATLKAMHIAVDSNIEPDIDSAAWERNQ